MSDNFDYPQGSYTPGPYPNVEGVEFDIDGINVNLVNSRPNPEDPETTLSQAIVRDQQYALEYQVSVTTEGKITEGKPFVIKYAKEIAAAGAILAAGVVTVKSLRVRRKNKT